MGVTETSDARALEIYQQLLDRITLAYETSDFEDYARMLRVPHDVSSFGPDIRLETRDDLQRLFNNMCNKFREQGITNYIRTCLAATFDGPDAIIGAHETRLMSGTHVVEQPYPVKSVLRKIDGNWMVCESDNAVDLKSSIGRVLAKTTSDRDVTPGPFSK